MSNRNPGQEFSVDRYGYLQLFAANHMQILLRLGAGCRHLIEIAGLQLRRTGGDQVSSTRSVGMNLARRFNAGIRLVAVLVA